MSIALLGDLHGGPASLMTATKIPGVTAVVQLGDFGIPRHRVAALDLAVPVYWIEGNHERWGAVAPMMTAGEPVEFGPGCFYVPRGTVLTLEGRRYLCAGGADSVDRAYQEMAGYWSACEQWMGEDELRIAGRMNVDVMLTHSPPHSTIAAHFDPNDLTRYFGLPNTWVSPVAEAVERVWRHHGCPPLYCGHMHRAVTDGAVRILDIGEIVLVAPVEREAPAHA